MIKNFWCYVLLMITNWKVNTMKYHRSGGNANKLNRSKTHWWWVIKTSKLILYAKTKKHKKIYESLIFIVQKKFSKMFTYFLSQRASSLFSCCILSKLTSEHILRVTKLCLQVDSLPLRRWIAPYKINCVVSTLITLDTPIWNHISKFEVETVSKSITVHMIVSAFCASYAFQLFVDIHK